MASGPNRVWQWIGALVVFTLVGDWAVPILARLFYTALPIVVVVGAVALLARLVTSRGHRW